MGNHRDIKRTAAQFLNGVAVAIVSVAILAPLVAGHADLWQIAVAALVAAAVHGSALLVGRS